MARKTPRESLSREVSVLREEVARLRVREAERAAAEEALRRREAQTRAVLETSPLGILMVRPDGTILWANARAAEMFGHAAEALSGSALETLLPKRFRAAHAGHRAGFFADPRVRPMGLGLELVARRQDGHEFPVEISLSYVQSDEGLVALAFITDVTRRKDAERRLQTEFAVTRVLAESTPLEDLPVRLLQAVSEGLDWDLGEYWRPDGDVLRHAASWRRAGLPADEFEAASRGLAFPRGVGLPGHVWADGRARWTDDIARDAGVLRAALAARIGFSAACAFPIRSEEALTGVIVLWGREAPRRDDALLTMLTDIGSRVGLHLQHRRTEDELARQREALYQSEKLAALGRLVAGVAHEMNNPLSIMSSRIELVLEDAAHQSLPPGLLEDLRVLHRNTLRVARVAQALRSFARHSTGERVPVSLNAVVEETLLLVQKPLANDSIAVLTSLDPGLRPLAGDANALQQVLLNLVTNAREALNGGGQIRLETAPAPGRPDWVQLVVADTGPGIASTDLTHIFEPFYTTKPTGTGLGLAVSYGIVQAHGGTIDVESTPGHGTTFTLTFPALSAPA
jgi:PAS domain S-box-containing protein